MDLLHTILATIVTLGILVTIHEWGHFYVARKCGVKVLRFSIGFGKPLYSWYDKQETEYVIAAIPLGGYVKMLDEREAEVPGALQDQAFNRKSVYQRIAIVAAGPLVNLAFAVIAYWFMFVYGVSSVAPVVGAVQQGSPAASVEIPPQSEIVSIDGHQTRTWDEVNLRLASRVGESGEVLLRLKPAESNLHEEARVVLDDWRVDLEKQSPVSALGLQPWRPEVPAVIGRVVENGQADKAGLLVDDEVVSVEGETVADWYALVALIQAKPQLPLNIEVLRQNQRVYLTLTPEAKQADDGRVYGYIGAAAASVEWPEEYKRVVQYDLLSAIPAAFTKTWQMITLTLDSIWKMIEGVISVKNLSGPITIAKVAGASAASGLESYISFLAYLSVSLGILNLLPIPVLDGGHLLYFMVEMVTGKPVSERIQLLGLKIGMAMILSLMLLALFNDFMRL